MKKLFLLFLILFVVAGGFLAVSLSLKSALEADDVRFRAEERVQKLFGARLSIGQVRFEFFRRLSLSGLNIQKAAKSPDLALEAIDRMVFRYSWKNLIERNFRRPENIVLEKPRFRLATVDLPRALFGLSIFRFSEGKSPISLNIREGMMVWNEEVESGRFGLEHLRGQIEPRGTDEIAVRFQGDFFGTLAGKLWVDGKVHPRTRQVDLLIRLSNVKQTASGYDLFRDLNGTLRWKGRTIVLEDFRWVISSMPFEVQGSIEGAGEIDSRFSLNFREMSKHSRGELSLFGDFEGEKIWGTFRGFGKNFPLNGKLGWSSEGPKVRDLTVGQSLRGDADFLLSRWETVMKFTSGKERYDLRLALRDFHIRLDVQADHFPLYDFDVVTASHIDLKPQAEAWNSGYGVFDGKLYSDYFIFDYTPLHDFQGTFTLSWEGLREIRLGWGKGHQMNGEIIFGHPPLAALDILISGLELAQVSRIGFHPLPENLTGQMEGKIRIRGEVHQPEVSGHLSIGNGTIKDIEFDDLLLNFFGNRHYLKLKDSKIEKGSRIFYVKGDVDFSNKNIFAGVEVISEDRLPLWSGKSMKMEGTGSPSRPLVEREIPQLERKF